MIDWGKYHKMKKKNIFNIYPIIISLYVRLNSAAQVKKTTIKQEKSALVGVCN